jgi:hypothetical protein
MAWLEQQRHTRRGREKALAEMLQAPRVESTVVTVTAETSMVDPQSIRDLLRRSQYYLNLNSTPTAGSSAPEAYHGFYFG